MPLNGGDEALLEATIKGLKAEFRDKNLIINVLTNEPNLSEKYISGYSFYWDYEYTLFSSRLRLIGLNIRLLIGNILFLRGRKLYSIPGFGAKTKIVRLYKEADIVILSAGSYLHNYYDMSGRLRTLRFALGLKKKIVLFGQSVGPFWKAYHSELVRSVLNELSYILLRETRSFWHLKELGVNSVPIKVTTDVCFLLYKFFRPSNEKIEKNSCRRIVMNFRFWMDEKERRRIVEKAVHLCKFLLSKEEIEITFISTCQGIEEYPDDSIIAADVVEQMDVNQKNRCKIDNEKYTLEALIHRYANFDLYIGMRLHGAILSMIGQTPAMNIGYEEKTEGIYSFLGLEEFQIHYRSPAEEWCKVAKRLMENANEIQSELPKKMSEASETCKENFSVIRSLLKEKK